MNSTSWPDILHVMLGSQHAWSPALAFLLLGKAILTIIQMRLLCQCVLNLCVTQEHLHRVASQEDRGIMRDQSKSTYGIARWDNV